MKKTKNSLLTLAKGSCLLGLLSLCSTTPVAGAPSSDGSGEIAIYSEATGTDVITTADFTHDFDTNGREDTGSFTRAGSDITLNRNGHYLAIYNSRFNGAPQAGTEERVEVQSCLNLAGTKLPIGWSQGFIRRQQNHLDAITTGMAVIEATANDVLQLQSFRTDTTAVGSVTRFQDDTAIQLVKLDDVNMSYARLSLAANQTGPATNGATAKVVYDTTDELDAGFSYASGDLTLADAGKYLVIANTYMIGYNNRHGFIQELTLDGTAISGTRTNIYLRGNQSTVEGAAAIGTIIETTAANQVLSVLGELDGTSGITNFIADRCGLTVIKLPSAAAGTSVIDPDFIRLSHTANQNINITADLNFNTQIEVDAEFTHSASTSGITVASGGDYLFLGSYYGANDGAARGLSNPGWAINGTRLNRGQSGRYTRNTGPPEFGNTLGLVASGLAASDQIKMVTRALAAGGGNNTNPLALQGVRLASLFTAPAAFEVIIIPTAIATTEGGATGTYDLALGLAPVAAGSVTVTISPDAQSEVSTDGTNFFPTLAVVFTDTTPQTITVRAADDAAIESTHSSTITHAITTSTDPANYPTTQPVTSVANSITDNDVVPVNAIDDSLTSNVSEDAVATEANLAPQANLFGNDTDGINNVVSAFDATSAEGATVNVLVDGTFTYDPSSSPSLQALASGESAVDTFTYTATDGEGNSDTATVTITVDGANDRPDAMPDVLNDGPLENASSFISSVDLTANDGSYRTVATDVTFPPGSDLRLLPGKTVTQTPSVGTPPGNGFPENAFDGNIGTFTHTESDNNTVDHSWQVDLGQEVSLDNVTLANRNDCCGARLRDITVRVLDGGGIEIFNSGPLNVANALSFTGGATETLFVDFAGPIMGQTVIVDRETDLGDANAGNGSLLSLSEVTLIGTVPGTFTLVDDNLLLNYDASNSAGTGRWENIGTSGGSNADWVLTDVILDPAPSTTRPQISAAYEWDNIADRAVFPGTGSNLSIQNNLSGSEDTMDATWEFWIKPANTTQIMTLFEAGGATGFGCVIDNGVLEAATELDGGTKSGSFVSYNLLTDPLGLVGGDPTTDFNQYAVAITVGSGLALYVNGVKVDETSGGQTNNDWDGSDGAGLGRFSGANHGGYQNSANTLTYDAPFLGQMAIVRLYSGAITAAQVFQNFKAVSGDTDIDGDTITATGVIDENDTFVLNGSQATLASGALVTMNNASGGFDYDPNGAFSLASGQVGTDTFTYRVDDGNGGTAEADVTVSITGVNSLQEDWRLLYYGDIANSGPGANSATAVNGLTNLQNFALDLDPTVVAGILDVDQSAGTISTLGPPKVWVDPATGRIYLQHTRRGDFAAISLTITDQFSRDLGVFEDSSVAPTVIATGTGDSGVAIEAVQTEFPLILPVSGGKGRFGRVDVTNP
ncbi:MAG: galactose-binding domain-containing protein [Verrucomicrobiales bacterium]|jgi:VCBS repeat-containing protein|tara:strand:+ start:5656 stop:9915 length:4260 start_codon:yes stop_codon:yes gene_type:complete